MSYDSDSDSDEHMLNAPTLFKAGQLVGIYLLDALKDKEPCRTSPLSGEAWVQEMLCGNARRVSAFTLTMLLEQLIDEVPILGVIPDGPAIPLPLRLVLSHK